MEWLIQEKGNRYWKALMGPQTQWVGATVDLQAAAKGFTVAVKSHLHSLMKRQPGGVFSLGPAQVPGPCHSYITSKLEGSVPSRFHSGRQASRSVCPSKLHSVEERSFLRGNQRTFRKGIYVQDSLGWHTSPTVHLLDCSASVPSLLALLGGKVAKIDVWIGARAWRGHGWGSGKDIKEKTPLASLSFLLPSLLSQQGSPGDQT